MADRRGDIARDGLAAGNGLLLRLVETPQIHRSRGVGRRDEAAADVMPAGLSATSTPSHLAGPSSPLRRAACMLEVVSRSAKVALVAALLVVAIVACVIGLPVLGIRSARHSAEQMAARLRPGDPIGRAVRLAQHFGSDHVYITDAQDEVVHIRPTRRPDYRAIREALGRTRSGTLSVQFTGFVFLRYYCDVTFRDSRVERAVVKMLD